MNTDFPIRDTDNMWAGQHGMQTASITKTGSWHACAGWTARGQCKGSVRSVTNTAWANSVVQMNAEGKCFESHTHFLPPHVCYMPYPSHPSYLLILIKFGEEYKLSGCWLCKFLQPPTILYLFGPNILLSTPFSNVFSLWSFLNIRDKSLLIESCCLKLRGL
jgi:hypothetical protein